jgi:hypothetical protein
MPGVGRIIPPPGVKKEDNEQKILQLFQEKAPAFLQFIPTTNLDRLAIGQHHGLPTRFLDWTRNPLVACYFAVEEDECEKDSVIYAYHNNRYINTDKNPEPFA